MSTPTELLAPKLARVPESASTYRLVRRLEPDEVAELSVRNREKHFRSNELTAIPTGTMFSAMLVLGSLMYLAANYGNWFLTNPLLLQLSLAVTTLYGTRRIFALILGRTKAGAFYPSLDYRRHLTGTDVTGIAVLGTLAIAHLALGPIAQAAAVVAMLTALLVAQRLNVRVLKSRLEAEELEARQKALTAGL